MAIGLTLLLLVFGAYYLADMIWTGTVRSKNGVFFRRSEDPTMFWTIFAIVAVGYAILLYEGVPLLLNAAR